MSQVFSNFLGNEKIKSLLYDGILSRQISHAYIVEGIDGSGRRTLINTIIKAVSCKGEGSSVPCDKCEICKKINQGFFGDIYTLNKEDKATISVKSVRTMLEQMQYSPNEDVPYKFFIIEEAEKMTAEAQNALLLSMEEPPSFVVFFLITNDSQSLLETIRSRAVILRMQKFSANELYSIAKSRDDLKHFSDDELLNACTVASGSIGKMLELLANKCDDYVIADDALKFCRYMCKSQTGDALNSIADVKYSREDYGRFFDYCISAVRDLINLKNGKENFTFFADKSKAEELSKKITVAKLLKLYECLDSAKTDIVELNTNIGITISALVSNSL